MTNIINKIRNKFYDFTESWRIYVEDLVPVATVDRALKSASVPNLGFFLMLGLSTFIATFGLLANSAAVVIGAMIIAPLMTPIMGVSYGIIILDKAQLGRSLFTVTMGILMVIGLSFILTELIELRTVGTEMVSRSVPTLLDLGVAVAAGATGAFSYSRESIKNSIAGVAISVALVPPLTVVGIGLALGENVVGDIGVSLMRQGVRMDGYDISSGAIILFLTNLVAIILVASLVLLIQGYGIFRRAMIGLLIIMICLSLLIQPLYQEFNKLQINSQTLELVKKLPYLYPDIFINNNAQITKVNINLINDVINIRISGTTESLMSTWEQQINLVHQYLSSELKNPVVLYFDITPLKTTHFKIEPEVKLKE